MTAAARSPAFDLALAAAREPSLLQRLRGRELPADMLFLLQLAGGQRAASEQAVEWSGLPEAAVVEAAQLFIQQMMFFPNADSFRVLGARPDADADTLKEHYRWLVRWVHPDRQGEDWTSVYADRVNHAWRELRSPEGRQAAAQRAAPGAAAFGSAVPRPAARPARDAESESPTLSGRTVRRLPTLALAALACGAITLLALQYALNRPMPAAGTTAATSVAPAALSDTANPPAGFAAHVAQDAATQGRASQLDAERLADDRHAADRRAADALAAGKRLAQARAAARLAEAKRASEQVAAQKLVAGKLAADNRAADRLAAGKAAAEQLAAAKVATERLAADKRAADKVALQLAARMLAARQLAARERAAPESAARLAALAAAAPKLSASTGKSVAIKPVATKPVAAKPGKAAAASVAAVDTPEPAPPTAPVPDPEARRVSRGGIGDAYAADAVQRFRAAYASGKIDQVKDLLVRRASGWTSDRGKILRGYEQLFGTSSRRRILVHDPTWVGDKDQAVLLATYDAWITANDATAPVHSRGDLRFDLRREDGVFRILRLRHQARGGEGGQGGAAK